jgi:hypothetical protein
MNRYYLFIPLAIALAGCGQGGSYTPKPVDKIEPASVAAGEEAKLYPLKVGNQWVYSSESGGRTEEVTIKVASVRQEGDATYGTLTTTLSGGDSRSVEIKVDSKGIFQVTSPSGAVYTPPQLLVQFPLDSPMATLDFTGPYPFNGEGAQQMAVKYIGVQEVDTDMGRMSTLAVESITTWTTEAGPARSYTITWWAPGIGFVRQRQEIALPESSAVILMKLKSYSFP